MMEILAFVLMSVPVIGFIGASVLSLGWKDALFVWGVTIAMMAPMFLGLWILSTQ